MDFKGHFPFGGGRCHRSPCWTTTPGSRCAVHCADERRETVQEQLVSVFERYGLPDRMTMDNGSPWGDTTGTDGSGAVADAPRHPGGTLAAVSSADAGQAGALSPQPEGGSAAGKWFATAVSCSAPSTTGGRSTTSSARMRRWRWRCRRRAISPHRGSTAGA